MENTKLVARFNKNFLALLHWGPAIALLDGTKRFTIPWWKDTILDIEPGNHHIKICINYLLIFRGICKAEFDFNVAPGDTIKLEYRHPLTIFQRGKISEKKIRGKTEQIRERKFVEKYLQPAFLICVFVLAIAGFGMSYVINRFDIYLKKEPLLLKKPLDLLDENGMVNYRVVKKYKIENEEVLQSLGTEDYIQWQLEDTSGEAADNVRNCFLFITYYDLPDRVPHVPEECYAGGGYQRVSSESIKLGIENGSREISVRDLVFSGTNPFGLENKFSAFYVFSVNGTYADNRQEVRTVLNKNIFGKHSYFCKVEWWYFDENGGGKSYLSENEAKAASEKLLSTVLPILEQQHLAEWKK